MYNEKYRYNAISAFCRIYFTEAVFTILERFDPQKMRTDDWLTVVSKLSKERTLRDQEDFNSSHKRALKKIKKTVSDVIVTSEYIWCTSICDIPHASLDNTDALDVTFEDSEAARTSHQAAMKFNYYNIFSYADSMEDDYSYSRPSLWYYFDENELQDCILKSPLEQNKSSNSYNAEVQTMLKKYGSDKEALYVRNLKRVKSIREDDDTKTIAYSLEKNILIPAVQITFFIEDKESNSFHDYDIIIIDDFNLNFYDSRIKRPATTFVFPRLPTLDFSKSLFL